MRRLRFGLFVAAEHGVKEWRLISPVALWTRSFDGGHGAVQQRARMAERGAATELKVIRAPERKCVSIGPKATSMAARPDTREVDAFARPWESQWDAVPRSAMEWSTEVQQMVYRDERGMTNPG
jgi:hypothetical protein